MGGRGSVKHNPDRMARRIPTLPAPFLKTISIKQGATVEKSKHPFNLLYLQAEDFRVVLDSPVTIFVGENGAGKSTLLEAIAISCGFNVLGGNKNHVYNGQKQGTGLHQYLNFGWLPKITKGFFLRAESFFLFADYLDDHKKDFGEAYDGYGGGSLHSQSHGESFMSLFKSRTRSDEILIFDEPEAALSPKRQVEFLEILKDLERRNNQIIMATHSPLLMSYPKAKLLQINDDGINETTYKETGHFKIWKDFVLR